MATFTGTNANEFITPAQVSATVTKVGGNHPSNADDTINSGGGDDVVSPGSGTDIVDLGAGKDRFFRGLDDGLTTLDGNTGVDTAIIFGTAGDDTIDIATSGPTTHISKNVTIDPLVDATRIEHLVIRPLDGIDLLRISADADGNLRTVRIDLAATSGGTTSDGDADDLMLETSATHNNIVMRQVGNVVDIAGYEPRISIVHWDNNLDEINLKGYGGVDRIDARGIRLVCDFDGQSGDDVLRSGFARDVLEGGNDHDRLFGGGAHDELFGGTGNDLLVGGRGADLIDGDDDIDFAAYIGSSAGVQVNLLTAVATGGDAQGDTFSDVEGLLGSAHRDILAGDDNANIVDGGLGRDLLRGNGAADLFRFSTALFSDNVDRLIDFTLGEDKVQLLRKIFVGIGTTLDTAEFTIGPEATALTHRIVYNDQNGWLIHDRNGSRNGGESHFATLPTGLMLGEGSFLMI